MILIKDALLYAKNKLASISKELAGLEGRILLEETLNQPLSFILSNPEVMLTKPEYMRFLQLIERRKKSEPIAYILGVKEFYGYEFVINKSVLIPRPDTETVIEVILNLNKEKTNDNLNILELGIGSGCIIISLLLETPNALGLGVDISSNALKISKQNAHNHGVLGRLKLTQSDWFKKISPQKFDFIVSNPPYITTSEENSIAYETLLYEPKYALFAKNNGLKVYEIIAKNSHNYLKKGGKIIVEIGKGQEEAVIEIFTKHSYNLVLYKKDLNDIIRVLVFNRG